MFWLQNLKIVSTWGMLAPQKPFTQSKCPGNKTTILFYFVKDSLIDVKNTAKDINMIQVAN